MGEPKYTWHAVGVNGHREKLGGDFLYTSIDAPIEADTYERMRQRAEAAERLLEATDFVDSGFCPHCHQDELRGITDAYNDYDDEEHDHIQVYHCGNCGAAWAGDPNQWVDLAKQLAATTKRAEAAEAELADAYETVISLKRSEGYNERAEVERLTTLRPDSEYLRG